MIIKLKAVWKLCDEEFVWDEEIRQKLLESSEKFNIQEEEAELQAWANRFAEFIPGWSINKESENK